VIALAFERHSNNVQLRFKVQLQGVLVMKKAISAIFLVLLVGFELDAQQQIFIDSSTDGSVLDKDDQQQLHLRAQAHMHKGVALFKADNFKQAAEEFSAAKDLEPALFLAHMNLGVTYLMLKEFQKAAVSLQTAVKLNDQSANAWHFLGFANSQMKKNDEALPCYRKALELNPKLSESLNNVGQILLAQDKSAEAESVFKQALEAKPDVVEPMEGLCVAYALEGKSELGVDQCSAAQKLNNSLTANYYLAWNYLDLHRYQDALPLLQRAVQLNPDRAEIHVALAEAYGNLGQYKPALENANQAISLNPKLDSAYSALGEVYSLMKKIDKAKAAFQTAIQLSSDPSGTSRYNLALTCLLTKNRGCALEQYNALKTSEPVLSSQLFDLLYGSKLLRVGSSGMASATPPPKN
jgi:tetratricopeptide (TPR) repeat protein